MLSLSYRWAGLANFSNKLQFYLHLDSISSKFHNSSFLSSRDLDRCMKNLVYLRRTKVVTAFQYGFCFICISTLSISNFIPLASLVPEISIGK